MNDQLDTDAQLKDVLERAAGRFDPDPDLRHRVDRRARRQRQTARLGLAAGLVVLVVVVASVTAIARRGGESLDVGANGAVSSVPGGDVAGPPVDWSTPHVTFRAQGLLIEAAGMPFTGGPDSEAELHSDPGTPNEYQTLERMWQENGVEMRMNIYFTSDGVDWWSDEIRTYNGAQGRSADWVTYTGNFFRRPLGTPFTGDLTLPEQADNHVGDGRLVLRGVDVMPFRPPASCIPGSGAFALEVLFPDVTIDASGYGINSRLYDPSCQEVEDLHGYRFVYTPAADGIVAVIPSCSPGSLTNPGCEAQGLLLPVANGQTTIQIDVLGAGDELVATGSMRVTVARPDLPGAPPPTTGS